MKFSSHSRIDRDGVFAANYDHRSGESTTPGVGFAGEMGEPIVRSLAGRVSIAEGDAGRLSVEVIEERQPGRSDRYAVLCGASKGVRFRFAFPAGQVAGLLPSLSKLLAHKEPS